MLDLFARLVDEQKFHPQFRALMDSSYHQEAKAYINDLYQRMAKPNKTFVRNFQGDGFHSHLFEISCFAYLESAGLNPERTHSSPDFLASHDGVDLAFEATSANPVIQGSDISLLEMKELSQREIEEKEDIEFPRRMCTILKKKLRLNYHKLPQFAGKPIILMVAPFFEPGSAYYIDESLLDCLYRNDSKTTGIFYLEKAESVSAVMYCNAFTVPRFFRLGTNLDDSANLTATREGWYYSPQPDGGLKLCEYNFLVGSPSSPQESWAEGVTVFHNPNAKIPISISLLPCSSHFSVQDGSNPRSSWISSADLIYEDVSKVSLSPN